MKHTSRRKDGRLERLITLHDAFTGAPVHKHIYAITTDDLNRKTAKMMALYADTNYTRMTVGQFLEYYLANRREAERDTSTVTNYTSMYRNHVEGTPFARMRLDSVNIPACRQFLREFQPIRGKATRVKQMLYGFLRMAFKQAWKEKLISENPWDFVDKPVHVTKESMILTRDQFEQLVNEIGTIQMQRIMRFALNTGLRRSEVCGIQLQDLHLDEGYIAIRKGVKRIDKDYVVGSTKTKATMRNLPIPPSIIALVKEQLADLPNQEPTAFLFQGMTGEYIAPDSLTQAFARARNKLGFPKEMRLHSLRATVATYLADLNFQPKKIQAKLGHASPYMTMTRYVKTTPEMVESMTDALDNFWAEN